MASITLQKCVLRQNHFVTTSEAPIILTWAELRSRLAPTGTKTALLSLRSSRVGGFLGLIRNPHTGQPNTFQCHVNDGTGRIDWLIRKDETIPVRLIEIFRVEALVWEGSVVEVT